MTDGRISHKGIERFFNYPFLHTIVQRRSRRFGLGFEITDEPLKYKSDHKPVPLSSVETALLCFAGAGSTGLALGDINTAHGGNTMMHWSSRAFPSPCNNHQTRLLFTNDEGIFLYKPREAEKIVEIESLEDLEKRILHFPDEVIKITGDRLSIPDGPPAMQLLNQGSVNRPGQTVFMPVVQPAYELINVILLNFQYGRYNYIDDATGQSAGIVKWVSKLKLEIKVPLSFFERNLLNVCSLEAGFISQNILLAAQAMGLGAFPPTGFNPLIVMGGTPVTKGLGFRYTTDKKGFPNPVGIDGFIEAYCPPYKTLDEAVDEIVRCKFGSGGIFSPDAKPTPFRDQAALAKGVDRIPEEVIQCTKDFCNYVYNQYGRFPGTVDSTVIPIWVAVHHLDLDFYNTFYPREAITENQREHMADWHSGE
ncbi:MAG: hypothetical protein ACUVWO_12850 [Thermodesulfobacteriota bacterium]